MCSRVACQLDMYLIYNTANKPHFSLRANRKNSRHEDHPTKAKTVKNTVTMVTARLSSVVKKNNKLDPCTGSWNMGETDFSVHLKMYAQQGSSDQSWHPLIL